MLSNTKSHGYIMHGAIAAMGRSHGYPAELLLNTSDDLISSLNNFRVISGYRLVDLLER